LNAEKQHLQKPAKEGKAAAELKGGDLFEVTVVSPKEKPRDKKRPIQKKSWKAKTILRELVRACAGVYRKETRLALPVHRPLSARRSIRKIVKRRSKTKAAAAGYSAEVDWGLFDGPRSFQPVPRLRLLLLQLSEPLLLRSTK
jgi:hypothetical protein